MSPDATILSDCIRTCATARDGRGRWRAEQRAAAALQRPDEPAGLAAMQAAAARRLGEWLATQVLPAGKVAAHA
jgi:hypothetical protein